jgi:hypothetical protein
MPEMPTSRFVMYGARTAIAGGLLHIQEHVDALERAVDENTGLAFDLAKTIIESTCRSILSDRRVDFAHGDDLPGLFKTARKTLSFLPSSVTDTPNVQKSLLQTLGGLSAAVQGICELRNACGFASHGSDGPRPVLESVQAILAAEAADTIVGFLYRIHTQDREVSRSAVSLYDSNADFNDYIDDAHERVRIFDEDFLPSRILFELAPEPYRLYLAEFRQEYSIELPAEGQIELPNEMRIELPAEDRIELPEEIRIEFPAQE